MIKDSKAKGKQLKWDISHVLIIVAVVLSYLFHWRNQQDDITTFYQIVGLTVGVGIGTAIVWKIIAKYTVEAFKSIFDMLHGKNDVICRIRSPQSTSNSLMDHLYMATEWSVFPTLVVFFVLSFIAQGLAPEGKSVMENEHIWIFMFIIPPIATFISIPIRLIADSSLMKFNTQQRILEPFGMTFKRMFRAVGGVGALSSFAKVSLNKGGIENAAMDTVTILLYVFPLMFIATILYGYWHPRHLAEIEKKIDTLHYSNYDFYRSQDGTLKLDPESEINSSTGSDDNDSRSNDDEEEFEDSEESDISTFPLEEDSRIEAGTGEGTLDEEYEDPERKFLDEEGDYENQQREFGGDVNEYEDEQR